MIACTAVFRVHTPNFPRRLTLPPADAHGAGVYDGLGMSRASWAGRASSECVGETSQGTEGFPVRVRRAPDALEGELGGGWVPGAGRA